MKESLSVTVVKSFAELEELAHTWDRLAAARPREEIFHTFAWARAWWQAYSTKYEVYTPVVRNSDNQVVAIWPLVRCGSELRALGHGASDQNDLLTAPEIADVPLPAKSLECPPRWCRC